MFAEKELIWPDTGHDTMDVVLMKGQYIDGIIATYIENTTMLNGSADI